MVREMKIGLEFTIDRRVALYSGRFGKRTFIDHPILKPDRIIALIHSAFHRFSLNLEFEGVLEFERLSQFLRVTQNVA